MIRVATIDRIVTRDGLAPSVIDDFAEAGLRLVEQGAVALTTSCGFMAIAQAEFAARLPVPVLTSSLAQIPWIASFLPPARRIGVLTIDARELTPAHFRAVGAPADLPIEGVEGGSELHRVIRRDLQELDPVKAEADVLQAGERLCAKASDLGAIVLECTNMAPYANSLARHLDLPVFDILGLLAWWRRGLEPPHFGRPQMGRPAG